jgi:hypothetical protein
VAPPLIGDHSAHHGSRRVEGGIPTMSDAVYTLELLGVLLGVGLLARISHRQL